MDIRLDDFSASDFDVKEWLNQQFATLDVDAVFDERAADSSERLALQQEQDNQLQKLTTQLHLLATNAQQNSDRIKARFRHQTSQIVRDLAALGKLVHETQSTVATFSETVNARSLSAPAVEEIVDIDRVRFQLERSVLAMEHLRNYTNLPQKISALVDAGELAQAWRLVDSASSSSDTASVGLIPEDVQRFGSQIEAAAISRLGEAITSHDADMALETCRLLAAHGLGKMIESTYIRLRSEIGVQQLQPALAECRDNLSDNIDSVLSMVSELVTQERAFIEAAEIPHDACTLLEALSANFIELLQPVIQRKIDQIRSGSSPGSGSEFASQAGVSDVRPVTRVVDLYHDLVSFYRSLNEIINLGTLSVGGTSSQNTASTQLSKPIPRSLNLLFVPFVSYMGSLGSTEADHIRSGSLQRLKRLAPDYKHIEAYGRDASAVLLEIFVDVEQALDRIAALVPVSKMRGAVTEIASVVVDISAYFTGLIRDIAKRTGIPLSVLGDFAGLSNITPGSSDSTGSDPIYQPLTNSEKLDAVSNIVGISLLSRIFDQYASALSLSMGKQWAELLDELRQQRARLSPDDNGSTFEQENGNIDGSSADSIKLLINAFMESCATVAEMQTVVVSPLLVSDAPVAPPGVKSVADAGSRLSSITVSAIYFLLTSAFRPPLARVPSLGVWHAEIESKSSMNISVPVFSSSPSEEAVDIGEKMHILLPELEQIEVMDAQYTRSMDLEGVIPSLYRYVISCLQGSNDSDSNRGMDGGAPSSSIQTMLSLTLNAVSKCFSRQIAAIDRPPLSESGKQQLSADIDYISSVISAFTSIAAPEFRFVRLCAWKHSQQHQDSSESADMPMDLVSEAVDGSEDSATLAEFKDKIQKLFDIDDVKADRAT
ncbi:hypothetical protein GGI15_002494 [Coemansia interrupta]|uniref:Conserved oligomeric Golgi complex subunit 7 n=1 Tax=Coemansia interrupta TaxID=1126814 RepID=A0A9W8LK33_9FUNG|nr:hypothetical protein GGI15_002494 [Coemansia interrupta]